jgi:glycosyltransferase involved in cell wall biosynthesis
MTAPTTNPSPTVSVVMAVFNGEKYLREAVESILNQTFRDFEFIAIDDGSTDGSKMILDELARRDPRLRVVSRPNKGLTPTLNEGLSLARGRYVARMDADDVAMPTRFEKQVAFLDANPDVVLLGGAYELIDEEGRLLTVQRPAVDDATLQSHCLAGRTPICHPLAMMRREALQQVGGYDESYSVAQDLDLWLRLGEVGRLACVTDVLLKYRMHETSVSEKKQQQQVANMRRAVESAGRRRGVAVQFEGEAGWRAMGGRESRFRQAAKFGWWAWHSGQSRTARHYALRAIRAMPLRAEGWKLLLAALFRSSDRAGKH